VLVASVLLAATLLGSSCDSEKKTRAPSPAAPVSGPIVVITLDGLRSDVVESFGGLAGLTPALDALAREADWFGPAVSASSASPSATASLLTGLAPHAHRAWSTSPSLAPPFETLPEALGGLGYGTRAFLSSEWLRAAPGFLQGFEHTQPLGIGRAAERELRAATGEPVLFWIEIAQPAPPYRLYPALLPRLDALGARVAPEGLPERLGLGELRPVARSSQPLSEAELGTWWAMYCLNVARADLRVDQLLGALRDSGAWDRSTVVVLSTRGEELGDPGVAEAGRGLRRRSIEVPLFVKLPAGLRERVDLPAPGETVQTASLWATLVGLAGGARPPGVVAGWLDSGSTGAWSERRAPDGELEVSWIRGGQQVLLELDAATGRETATVWTWTPDGAVARLEHGEDGADGADGSDEAPARAHAAEVLSRWRLLAGEPGETPAPLATVERPGASRRHRDSG
jgi:arylsulfatase A-like enzyme